MGELQEGLGGLRKRRYIADSAVPPRSHGHWREVMIQLQHCLRAFSKLWGLSPVGGVAVWFGLRGIGMLVYLSIFSMWHQMRLECSPVEPVVRGKRTGSHIELYRKAQISAP